MPTSLRIGAVMLVASTVTLGSSALYAQQVPDGDVVAMLTRLREAPDALGSRTAALQRSIDRKRRFLVVLRQRIESASADTDERLRTHRLSRYSYQAFLVTSRIAAEASKLSEIESVLALAGQAAGTDAAALVRKALEGAMRARVAAADRLLQEAEQYRSAITEPTFAAQFEQLLTGIRAERNRLRELQ